MLKLHSKITKTKPKTQQNWDYKLIDIDFEKRIANAIFADGSKLNVSIENLIDQIPAKYQVESTKQLYITH